METSSRGSRGSAHLPHGLSRGRGRGVSKNMHWSAGGTDSARWERGGHRGGGRGRGTTWTRGGAPQPTVNHDEEDEDQNTEEAEEEMVEETVEEPEVVDYQEVRGLLDSVHEISCRF